MLVYDNPYHPDNVYGHAISLLTEHSGHAGGVHLDVGCNVGPIAEQVRDTLHRDYIGFDIDDVALEQLRARGFDAHRLDLTDIAAAEAQIRAVVAGRPVASITILDTLEHVPNGPDVLAMLRRVAADERSPLVTSVPNMTHRDIGFKLALGRWDYTLTGLLDYTHLHFFSNTGMQAMLRAAGWHQIAANDVFVAQSDQHFPAYHPAVAEATTLHKLLDNVRDGVDEHAGTNQFVRIWLPGPAVGQGHVVTQPSQQAPFLSVVTRTQGRRLDTLRDVLLCLSAQSDQDFELLVLGHRLTDENRYGVERVIEDTCEAMRRKVRLIKVDSGNRTHPLNVGFAEARGDYVAILDDDDIILGNWVEEFRSLARKNPGTVLRAANVSQLWEPVHIHNGSRSVRAVGGMDACYPLKFDHLDHLVENASPPVSLAFPRAAFSELHIHFDETLTTTEDWDFLMRVAAICGTASSPAITSIYRQWNNAESSFTVHSKEEWLANHQAIWRKLDAVPLLLEPGMASRIRALLRYQKGSMGGAGGLLVADDVESARYQNALRQDIHLLLNSRTWRLAAPLRCAAGLFGRRSTSPMLWAMNGTELEAYKTQLLHSRTWRLRGAVRRWLGR